MADIHRYTPAPNIIEVLDHGADMPADWGPPPDVPVPNAHLARFNGGLPFWLPEAELATLQPLPEGHH